MENYSDHLMPEEKELFEKKKELTVLEEELFQQELDLATTKADLLVYEGKYIRIVGSLYAELDEIEAQISEAEANLDLNNKETLFKAKEARRKAQESHEATTSAIIEKAQKKFRPSDEIKKLYRQAAKAMHPDLSTDEKSHTIRKQMMAEVNLAYEEGSEEKLCEILRRWETSPDSVEGEGVGAELIRIIRKITQIKDRLKAIKVEISDLEKSESLEVKGRNQKSRKRGKRSS